MNNEIIKKVVDLAEKQENFISTAENIKDEICNIDRVIDEIERQDTEIDSASELVKSGPFYPEGADIEFPITIRMNQEDHTVIVSLEELRKMMEVLKKIAEEKANYYLRKAHEAKKQLKKL